MKDNKLKNTTCKGCRQLKKGQVLECEHSCGQSEKEIADMITDYNFWKELGKLIKARNNKILSY